MFEDKVEIVQKLEDLINATRMGEVKLNYIKDYSKVDPISNMVVGFYDEAVEIRADGVTVGVANVSMDSGIALIRDVLKHPYFN